MSWDLRVKPGFVDWLILKYLNIVLLNFNHIYQNTAPLKGAEMLSLTKSVMNIKDFVF